MWYSEFYTGEWRYLKKKEKEGLSINLLEKMLYKILKTT